MFEAKDEITDAVNRVAELMAGSNRGDTIGWGAIEQTAGFARYTQHWAQFLKRLRKKLLVERGIRLTAVVSVGLHLCTAEEQLKGVDRQRRALRQMGRHANELQAIPASELSVHQQADRARRVDQVKKGRRAVLYSLRVSHQLTRATGGGVPWGAKKAG